MSKLKLTHKQIVTLAVNVDQTRSLITAAMSLVNELDQCLDEPEPEIARDQQRYDLDAILSISAQRLTDINDVLSP